MKKIINLVFMLLVIGLNACQENDEFIPPDVGVEKNFDFQQNDMKLSTYSKAPFLYEKIDEPYENYGRIAYRFLKYRDVLDPVEYLAEPSRITFEENYDRVKKQYEGLSVSEVLEKMKGDGLLTKEAHNLYSKFFNDFFDKISATESVEEVWDYLRNYEKQLQSRADLKGEEETLLTFSSLFRNYVKFKYEVELLNADEKLPRSAARTCIFGKRLGCWGEVLGVAVLAGVSVALAAVSGGSSVVAGQVLWLEVIKAGGKAAATSFMKGTERISKEARCSCGGTSPPSCAQPTGLQVLAEDCSGIFSARVLGGGLDPRYTWTIKNGELTEFNDEKDATYVPDKLVYIRQIDYNKPVQISLTEHCRDGATRFYDLDREINGYELSRSPYAFTIRGSTSVPLGSTKTYEAYGISSRSVNLNNSFKLSSNFSGQVVESGIDWIKVKWNVKSGGGAYATVHGSNTNACNGSMSTYTLRVNVY